MDSQVEDDVADGNVLEGDVVETSLMDYSIVLLKTRQVHVMYPNLKPFACTSEHKSTCW